MCQRCKRDKHGRLVLDKRTIYMHFGYLLISHKEQSKEFPDHFQYDAKGYGIVKNVRFFSCEELPLANVRLINCNLRSVKDNWYRMSNVVFEDCLLPKNFEMWELLEECRVINHGMEW